MVVKAVPTRPTTSTMLGFRKDILEDGVGSRMCFVIQELYEEDDGTFVGDDIYTDTSTQTATTR